MTAHPLPKESCHDHEKECRDSTPRGLRGDRFAYRRGLPGKPRASASSHGRIRALVWRTILSKLHGAVRRAPRGQSARGSQGRTKRQKGATQGRIQTGSSGILGPSQGAISSALHFHEERHEIGSSRSTPLSVTQDHDLAPPPIEILRWAVRRI